MNGQIKLTEALKILYVPIYPTKWEQKKTLEDERTTRATQANIIPETAKTTMSQATYDNDAKKLWNKAPMNIKHSKSLNSAKNKSENM